MRRSTDRVLRAASWGRADPIASHGSKAAFTSGDSRRRPKQYTSRSTRPDRCSERYSTWTPAPPYTSGGYSRESNATRMAEGGPAGSPLRDLLPFPDDDDALGRHGEPGLVEDRVDPDLRPRRHLDVLVDDGAADDGPRPDHDRVHPHRVPDPAVGADPPAWRAA